MAVHQKLSEIGKQRTTSQSFVVVILFITILHTTHMGPGSVNSSWIYTKTIHSRYQSTQVTHVGLVNETMKGVFHCSEL